MCLFVCLLVCMFTTLRVGCWVGRAKRELLACCCMTTGWMDGWMDVLSKSTWVSSLLGGTYALVTPTVSIYVNIVQVCK